MNLTVKTNGRVYTIKADKGFEVFVDGELLLSHEGEPQKLGGGVAKGCCGNGCCDKADGYTDVGYGRESLFSQPEAQRLQEAIKSIYGPKSTYCESKKPSDLNVSPETSLYYTKDVINSSFIECIRWWNWEETLGNEALEVTLKDGRILNYGGVPVSVYSAWVKIIVAGGSAGRFFNEYIKNEYELISEIDANGNFLGEGDEE